MIVVYCLSSSALWDEKRRVQAWWFLVVFFDLGVELARCSSHIWPYTFMFMWAPNSAHKLASISTSTVPPLCMSVVALTNQRLSFWLVPWPSAQDIPTSFWVVLAEASWALHPPLCGCLWGAWGCYERGTPRVFPITWMGRSLGGCWIVFLPVLH